MAKKKSAAKSGPVWRMGAEEATLAKMPKYNGHACGSGAHGDTKYNRAKQKRAWKEQISQEARTRGPLLYIGRCDLRSAGLQTCLMRRRGCCRQLCRAALRRP